MIMTKQVVLFYIKISNNWNDRISLWNATGIYMQLNLHLNLKNIKLENLNREAPSPKGMQYVKHSVLRAI
jgi:hypothetical protein